MPGHHPPYPPEFRQQIVELARIGRAPAELARKFEPRATTVRTWVKQADRDDGLRDDGPTSEEKEELGRERRQLRREREILQKAAAWFAKETDSIPSGDLSW